MDCSMPRTKIICTIGPASRKESVLREMLRAGMRVARINFSHGDQPEHKRDMALLRRLAEEASCQLAILADLQGPKFRVGKIEGDKVHLITGESITLTSRPPANSAAKIHVPHPELIRAMQPGNRVLLDDGLLELEVEAVEDEHVRCKIVNGGILKNNKGISLVGGRLNLPAVTEKDCCDLAFALEQGIDFVAQSFVRTAEDIHTLRQAMADLGKTAPIIAKIEKAEAIDHFDEILAVADGVMVARGDLGVESSLAKVPIYQKRLITQSNLAAKPVITATQMLDSMTQNARPTRAEVSDVANAVLDGTDAVMLSGETAIGKDPVNVVRTMANILKTAEENFPYAMWVRKTTQLRAHTVTDAISQTACEMAEELSAAAIICPTRSGQTARFVARHRPRSPIFATTPNLATYRQLALVWGVQTQLTEHSTNTDETIRRSIATSIEELSLKHGDMVVVTAGVPFGEQSETNMVQIQTL